MRPRSFRVKIRVYAWGCIAYNRGPRRGVGSGFGRWKRFRRLLCPAFLKIGPFTGPFS